MTQYISKDALVAEIERRVSDLYPKNGQGIVITKILKEHYKDLKDFINTLEVKKVDLDYIKKELDEVVKIHKPNGEFGWGTLYNVATHFFELGLKAQNHNGKCKDLGDDGTCMYAANKTGKAMHCENINCSRKIKAQKGVENEM